MDVQENQKREIGRRLKSVRERAHLSEEDAAQVIGVQPIAIRRWEKGAALPSLLEFRAALCAYGVMACDVLYEKNPWRLSAEHAAELAGAAHLLSPSLRAKVDLLLAMHSEGVEPVWKG